MRPRSFEDHPIPSGSSSAAYALLRIFAVTGDRAYERPAVEVFRLLHQAAARHPQAFGHLLQAMHFHFSTPREVALVGEQLDELAARRAPPLPPHRRAGRHAARRRGGARRASRSCAGASRCTGARPPTCARTSRAGCRLTDPAELERAARVTATPAAAAGELALGEPDGQQDRAGRTVHPGRRALPPAAAARAGARRESDRHGGRVRQQRGRQSPAPCTPIPDGLVIATKGGQTFVDGQPTGDGRPEYLREACERSLRRLRVDTIDLYQLHMPDPEVPIEESVGALAELPREGKVREIGVSNVFGEQLELARRTAPIVSVQNRYSLMHRDSETEIAICEREGMAYMPWWPLAGGELAGLGRAAGARVAAAAIAGDASDPGHGVGGAPRGERRGGGRASDARGSRRIARSAELWRRPDRGCNFTLSDGRAAALDQQHVAPPVSPSSPAARARRRRGSRTTRTARGSASFSGKIQPSSVQMPACSDASTSACPRTLPTPLPLSAAATYMLTSATPRYTCAAGDRCERRPRDDAAVAPRHEPALA